MLNGISDALKVGVALVPEDRKKEGLVLKNSVGFNLTLAVLGEFIRGIHVDRSKEEKIIDQYVDAMSIKASSSRVSIIMISSELPEIIGMCDRIYVMSGGRVTGELNRGAFSQETMMNYATGGK